MLLKQTDGLFFSVLKFQSVSCSVLLIAIFCELTTFFFQFSIQLFVDIGSNQLENKHVDFTFGSLHFLQSSYSAVQFF